MDTVQIADGAYAVVGRLVNWVVLVDGDALTLVDAGYPGQLDALEASVRALGHRLEQVEAVLVTHAHVDHVGTLPELVARHATPVLTGAVEAAHARREFLEQAGVSAVLAKAWRPRWARWLVGAARVGVAREVAVPSAAALDQAAALDLPGRPVPVPTPGHTTGHTAFGLPAVGAVITGDALVTGHPTSARPGPQLLDDVFHHDTSRARDAGLDALAALDADVVVPGHGPVHRGPVADAVARARE